MGVEFPSPNRFFVIFTFYLISLIFSVGCSEPKASNGLSTTLDKSDNKTKPLANHTVLYVGNMNTNNDFSSSTKASINTTDLILIIGCVFSIAFLSVIVFAIYRYQVRKKAEYQRAAKVQVSSTRNAGVYMDLAMDSPTTKVNLPISVPIYNSKKRQDQYTFISDEELDL